MFFSCFLRNGPHVCSPLPSIHLGSAACDPSTVRSPYWLLSIYLGGLNCSRFQEPCFSPWSLSWCFIFSIQAEAYPLYVPRSSRPQSTLSSPALTPCTLQLPDLPKHLPRRVRFLPFSLPGSHHLLFRSPGSSPGPPQPPSAQTQHILKMPCGPTTSVPPSRRCLHLAPLTRSGSPLLRIPSPRL